jgi:hypothetical protein
VVYFVVALTSARGSTVALTKSDGWMMKVITGLVNLVVKRFGRSETAF